MGSFVDAISDGCRLPDGMSAPWSITTWLREARGELRLAARTTFAALLTFALAHLLALPQGFWAVLTSVIVMQASVGGSLKASLDRIVGTVAGGLWGVAVTLAVPHHDTWTLGLVLAAALAPLALVAALRPTFRVAPVTAVIVLLSTSGAQLGPVRYAIDRVLEIGLGCLVAVVVALLVLPARAHRLLAEAAADTVLTLRDLLDLILGNIARSPDPATLAATHLKLGHTLTRVEGFVDEAKRERANRLSEMPDAEPVARNLRRLRHDLTAIGRAVMKPLPEPARQCLGESLVALRVAVSDYLAGSAAALRGIRALPSLEPVDRALLSFRDSMDRFRGSRASQGLDIEGVERVFSLAFAVQELRGNLGDLADRIAERGLGLSASPS
jgi:uncharacterized membrane protein YccC